MINRALDLGSIVFYVFKVFLMRISINGNDDEKLSGCWKKVRGNMKVHVAIELHDAFPKSILHVGSEN